MANAWPMPGWYGTLARLPARLSGAGRSAGNGVRLQTERLTRSVRRVAGRYGPVARATHDCKHAIMPDLLPPGYFAVKSVKTTQTLVAQASKPAVSQVSKPACRVFSTVHPNLLAPLFSRGYSRLFPNGYEISGQERAGAALAKKRQARNRT